MAKTMMISNEVYEELKKMKEDKSFSTVLKDLIEAKKNFSTGNSLKIFFGVLSDNKSDVAANELGKGWKKWTKRYA